MVLLLGVDEAGRGSVIGPMVICGYAINDESVIELKKIGVADSKKLTPQRRMEIREKLLSLSNSYEVRVITAERVNSHLRKRGREGINMLEADVMAEIINKLRPDVAIIDSPERDTVRFADKLRTMIRGSSPRLICENKADERYPVVSAASIIAKTTRDMEIEKLRREYGDFGSGYPSDPKTLSFIKKTLREKGLPPIVREDWRTIAKARQLTLFDFG